MHSSSRPARKRALVEVESSTTIEEQPLRRARRDVISTELETIKAELEHERSLRALDAKRFQQTKQRQERQVEFAVEEAKEAKSMMDELREESEGHIAKIREARLQAQYELRDCQLQLEEERALGATAVLEEDPKIERLEAEVHAKATENEALRGKVDYLRDEMRQMAKEEAPPQDENEAPGSSSLAPTAVLRELNKVRIQLAESERKNRQLRRAAEDLQKKAKQLVHERESARSATGRVQQLEKELKDSSRAHEAVQADLKSWKEFGTSMTTVLTRDKPLSSDPNVPPELSVVKRYLNEAPKRAEEAENENKHLKKQLDKSEEMIKKLENTSREFQRKETSWKIEQQDMVKRIELLEKQIKILKGQESVWRREVDSLRAIVKTFDDLPLGKDSTASSGASQASVCMLESSLDAARDEIKILKEGQDGLKKDLDAAVSEKAELQKTHNAVLEKFGKLRDAVYAERAKSEKAEERACKAEELAGKGSFNPDTTRVLHLQHNPLSEALKEEVSVLRRQVEALSKGKQNAAMTTDVDPNKLHQRLKESFKEQIGRFREGVYLITGFKIDMIPDNDRPRFKVRSLFAEHENDHLMFKWPEGKDVHSLDMMETEHAKLLTTTPSYEYVTRCHSIPAFLASVQLSLFEKQTMM
jgi:mitotic spindle assembly checkpoint protein MAD1